MDAHQTRSYWLGILYSALHPPLQRLGSFANLEVARIPEGADGFKIVREWVEDVCCDLGYNKSGPADRSRQWFMVACTLTLDLDRENALDFVPYLPMYRSTLCPQSVYCGEGELIVEDFVAFITAEVDQGDELLTFGSSYLRCVQRYAWIHLNLF